ncbi:MAG TPA: molybdopterin-dependent oxidoreductase [Candidatus Dormibacteraeota bacterium]|nr:molybdopterin-dependent oxidoreductase [Candidatus Dormibacteraeota bacterium]
MDTKQAVKGDPAAQRDHPVRRGLLAGAVGGIVAVALMYVLAGLVGLRPLPQLLQQPILDVMPGAVFGFLIDTLQHAGKVVEEAGLIVGMVAGLSILGGVYGWLRRRHQVAHLAMAVGGLGWLVVNLVLLPISGDGFGGSVEGPVAWLLWGLLLLVYSVVLESGYQGWFAPLPPEADAGRRRALWTVPLTVAGGSLAVLGIELVPGWYRSIFAAPGSDLAGPSPELTPVAEFYVVSKNFTDPVVDAASWSLNIHGLVDQPQRFNLAALQALRPTTEYVTLECISNNVGGPQISTGQFSGPSLRDVLQLASVKSSATLVAFTSRDGYTESLPLALVQSSPEILLALSLDGAPLPDQHGFPARILVPGHYGMKGPKWVQDIELATGSRSGYWENQGWNPDASVKTTARFDQPPQGSLFRAGPVALSGIAFAGKRGISGVEYSADGGRRWSPADLKTPLGPLTWVTWTATWTAAPGAFTLLVRARDGGGVLQSGTPAPSYPSGAGGYHSVAVSISA